MEEIPFKGRNDQDSIEFLLLHLITHVDFGLEKWVKLKTKNNCNIKTRIFVPLQSLESVKEGGNKNYFQCLTLYS